MKALTVVIGLAMLGAAAVLASGWARPAVMVGVPAVLLTLPERTRSPAAVTAAAMATLATATGGGGVSAVLGEGLLIFSYLLSVETVGESRPFRFVLPALATGSAGSGTVALALLLPTVPSTGLVLMGLTAIAVAYALAVPPRR
ncbi:hypothetical protein [Actinoallomurus acaciae]|uniref:Uncharacterized protein n=1 Tax=Actinoallomurus acaciae TaxID=502577 RepID=A0ABV5Y922_9ACTN